MPAVQANATTYKCRALDKRRHSLQHVPSHCAEHVAAHALRVAMEHGSARLPTAMGKVVRALRPKPLVQAAARRAGAELLAAAVGEAGPARLLAAAGGWLAACVAALRPGEDARVQRGAWRALAALFQRLGALAGAPGARREGAALVGRLMPAALPLLQAPPGARDAPSPLRHSAEPDMRSCCAAQTMLPQQRCRCHRPSTVASACAARAPRCSPGAMPQRLQRYALARQTTRRRQWRWPARCARRCARCRRRCGRTRARWSATRCARSSRRARRRACAWPPRSCWRSCRARQARPRGLGRPARPRARPPAETPGSRMSPARARPLRSLLAVAPRAAQRPLRAAVCLAASSILCPPALLARDRDAARLAPSIQPTLTLSWRSREQARCPAGSSAHVQQLSRCTPLSERRGRRRRPRVAGDAAAWSALAQRLLGVAHDQLDAAFLGLEDPALAAAARRAARGVC